MSLSKIFKLTFSVVLSFFIILSSLPLAGLTDIGLLNNINSSVAKAANATSGTCGNDLKWKYNILTGTLTISGKGDMTDFPDYSPWDSYIPFLKAVVIEDGVTSIGGWAFVDCANLKSVTIPDSMTKIGVAAFASCSDLENITIPDGITYIGDWAFSECESLENISIPSKVTKIGEATFRFCTSLKSVTVPYGVTSIGNSAFQGCTSLTSITIPACVTNIDVDAFYDCTNLSSITIPDSITNIGENAFDNTAYYNNGSNWKNGVLYIGKHLIKAKDTILGAYKIKNGTKVIANYAFYNCTSLTSIIVPDSVTNIGISPFSGCEGLTSITVEDNNKNYLSDEFGVLFDKGKTKLIQYPASESITDYIIPDSVTSICNDAFYHCTSLTSITIPDSVTSIGDNAFFDCTNLANISLPADITSIGDCAFSVCENLTDIYYSGSKADWSKISIGEYNDCLTKAVIHYDYISDVEVSENTTVQEETAVSVNDETAADSDANEFVFENTEKSTNDQGKNTNRFLFIVPCVIFIAVAITAFLIIYKKKR